MFERINKTPPVQIQPVQISVLEKMAIAAIYVFSRQNPGQKLAKWLEETGEVGLQLGHLITDDLLDGLISKRLIEEVDGTHKLTSLGHWFAAHAGVVQEPKYKSLSQRDIEMMVTKELVKLIHLMLGQLAKRSNDDVWAETSFDKIVTKVTDLTIKDWAAE